MAEYYKLEDIRGNAFLSLLFRFIRLVILLNIITIVVYIFAEFLEFNSYINAELVIVALCFIPIVIETEAEKITFEENKVFVYRRNILGIRFRNSAEYKEIRYKFIKPRDRRFFGLLPGRAKVILYKNKGRWATFNTGPFAWSRINLADLIKSLIARGCYNWFDFNKKG